VSLGITRSSEQLVIAVLIKAAESIRLKIFFIIVAFKGISIVLS